MTNPQEFEEKVPFYLDTCLRHLNSVADALKRNAFREALKYTGDAMALVQNELDWSYLTDPVLPFLREFLIKLGDAIVSTEQVVPACRKPQVTAIIEVINTSMDQVAYLSKDVAKHTAPDASIDVIEREHRTRTYGYDTSDQLEFNSEAYFYGDDE